MHEDHHSLENHIIVILRGNKSYSTIIRSHDIPLDIHEFLWKSHDFYGFSMFLPFLGQSLTHPPRFANQEAYAYFMSAKDVARVIWSSAELKLPPAALQAIIKPVTYTLRDVAGRLSALDASAILLAAAKLGSRSPELLDQMPLMAQVLPEPIQQMNAQSVSTSIWAVAKLPREASKSLLTVIPHLVRRANKVKDDMEAQPIVNILWTTAVLKKASPELLSSVPILIDRLIQSEDLAMGINEQGVSNCLLASEKLQHLVPEVEELIPVLGKRLEATIEQMIGQAVSSTLLLIGQRPEHFQVLRSSVPELAGSMHSLLDAFFVIAILNRLNDYFNIFQPNRQILW